MGEKMHVSFGTHCPFSCKDQTRIFDLFFAVCLNVWKLTLLSPQEAEKVQYVLVSIVTSIWQGVGVDS